MMNHVKNVVVTGNLGPGENQWSQNLNLNFNPSKMQVTRITVSALHEDEPAIYAIYFSGSTDPIGEVVVHPTAEDEYFTYSTVANEEIWISGPLTGTTSFWISEVVDNSIPGADTAITITLHLRFEP